MLQCPPGRTLRQDELRRIAQLRMRLDQLLRAWRQVHILSSHETEGMVDKTFPERLVVYAFQQDDLVGMELVSPRHAQHDLTHFARPVIIPAGAHARGRQRYG